MPDLVIEVRSEELPVSMIAPALQALSKGLVGLIEGVEHGVPQLYSTPRRIAVVVPDTASGRPVETVTVTGPSLQVAKRDGEWTRAAQGFARGKGITPEQLEVVDGPKGPVIAATVRKGGEQTAELVAAGLEKLVLGLPFRKSMRWGARTERWGRPIHQVNAVFAGARIPATVAGVETSAQVEGLRLSQLGPGSFIDGASWLDALEARNVIADRGARRARIEVLLTQVEAEHGVRVTRGALLEEVTDLVEWPELVVGTFDPELLQLPHRLLVEAMEVHQRYFATFKDGQLTNTFVVISNNPWGDAALIAEGNRRVLAARFHDARFFYAEDRKLSLAQHGLGLGKMRWVRGLGTMADKQSRVAALATRLAVHFDADPDTTGQAGALAKADLLSQMVNEFPKLQGHMGLLYARNDGLDALVGQAIEEHYLPRHSGDAIPKSGAGAAVALADRLDTLAGCFGIGLVPKGSADPQGLRRAANGVLAIIRGTNTRVSLNALVDQALADFDNAALKRSPEQARSELVPFVLGRLRATLMAEGHSTDIVDAVLAAGGDDPVQLAARVAGLTELSRSGEFAPLMTAFKRVLNISKDHTSEQRFADRYVADAERTLDAAFVDASQAIPTHVEALEIDQALARMIRMKPAIDHYFDDVMVMSEDLALREARLGLLTAIAGLFRSVADFRVISTE